MPNYTPQKHTKLLQNDQNAVIILKLPNRVATLLLFMSELITNFYVPNNNFINMNSEQSFSNMVGEHRFEKVDGGSIIFYQFCFLLVECVHQEGRKTT